MQLAKAGFYNGDPERVLEARVDLVMKTLDYQVFSSEYESEFHDLNSGST